MDAHIEALVELYLTRGGSVFVSPQYSVTRDDKPFWEAVPDFVALDFKSREVVIVEVTSSWNLDSLFRRVEERQDRWFIPIENLMRKDSIVDNEWRFRFLGFVRQERVDFANGRFSDRDVHFLAFEQCSFMYDYWNERSKALPGSFMKE